MATVVVSPVAAADPRDPQRFRDVPAVVGARREHAGDHDAVPEGVGEARARIERDVEALLDPHAAVRHHALILGVVRIHAGVGDREPQVVRAGRDLPRIERVDVGAQLPVVGAARTGVVQPPLARVAEDRIVGEAGVERGARRLRSAGLGGIRRRRDPARLVHLDPIDLRILGERRDRRPCGHRVGRCDAPDAGGVEVERVGPRPRLGGGPARGVGAEPEPVRERAARR